MRSALPRIIVGSLILVSFAHGTTPYPLPTATILMPATNTNTGGVTVGDAGVVYALSDPLLQPYAPTNDKPFTHLITHVFLVRFTVTGRRIVLRAPHQLFAGPPSMGIYPHAVTADWLIYLQSLPSITSAPWILFARHITTGRTVVLDSSESEGLASLGSRAQCDGRTVVWQTWTLRRSQPTLIVRSYDLVTGQRHIVAEGGTPTTWSYAGAAVSGHSVVFEKDSYRSSPRAQILLADLTTGRVRTLTSATAANSEPSIAGDIVAWKVGWRFEIGRAVMIYNLRTSREARVFVGPIEQPQVLAGGQIVFPAGIGPWRIQLYDVATAMSRSLDVAQPTADGYAPGNLVEVGRHTVAYWLVKFSTTTTPNPTRLVVTFLP